MMIMMMIMNDVRIVPLLSFFNQILCNQTFFIIVSFCFVMNANKIGRYFRWVMMIYLNQGSFFKYNFKWCSKMIIHPNSNSINTSQGLLHYQILIVISVPPKMYT